MNFTTLSTFFGKKVYIFISGHWFEGTLKETQEADFVILNCTSRMSRLTIIDIASISAIREV
jgi:hypothetical protein